MKVVLILMALTFVLMVFVYQTFSKSFGSAILAAVVMAIAGFFFAAVSGNLVGTIGSSNNPISGLTLSTLIIAALLMVVVGATGTTGVAAVLGVAAVVCVSSAVAGEMLQDLKVGHILGGTPYKMQIGNIFGILVASLVMYFPLMLLNGAFTFGSKDLPAPQAGLMAALSKGIVGGEMAWPLVIVGMLMGFAFILVQVRSPMLVAVGMYLPLETTFAIFVGGMFKGLVDKAMAKRKFNAAQTARATNVGILLAAGLIAGEGLMGLVRAAWKFFFLQQRHPFDIPTDLQGRQVLRRRRPLHRRPRRARPDRALPHQDPAQERGRRRRTAASVGRHLSLEGMDVRGHVPLRSGYRFVRGGIWGRFCLPAYGLFVGCTCRLPFPFRRRRLPCIGVRFSAKIAAEVQDGRARDPYHRRPDPDPDVGARRRRNRGHRPAGPGHGRDRPRRARRRPGRAPGRRQQAAHRRRPLGRRGQGRPPRPDQPRDRVQGRRGRLRGRLPVGPRHQGEGRPALTGSSSAGSTSRAARSRSRARTCWPGPSATRSTTSTASSSSTSSRP